MYVCQCVTLRSSLSPFNNISTIPQKRETIIVGIEKMRLVANVERDKKERERKKQITLRRVDDVLLEVLPLAVAVRILMKEKGKVRI